MAAVKAIFFCTSFMRGEDEWTSRYLRWLTHHRRLEFTDTRFIMIDDGSPFVPDSQQIRCISSEEDPGKVDDSSFIVRFDQRLGRNAPISYHGWWRSFLHSVSIARALGVPKIIHVESDAFLLSPRIVEYIKALDQGWTTFWTPRYRMPESAIQVICADQFDSMEQFRRRRIGEFDRQFAERILPFTNVRRDFIGDRYSEVNILKHTPLRLLRFHKMPLFQGNFFRGRIPLKADFVTQIAECQRTRLARFIDC